MKNQLKRILPLIAIIAGTLIPSEKVTSSLESKPEINLQNIESTYQKNLSQFLEPEILKNYNINLAKIREEIKENYKKENKDNYKTDDFYKDTNEMLLARMLLGECENCSEIEKIAVAYTAINRSNDGKKWNGETLREVILKPYQYSAFNENLNAKLKNPLAYNSKEFFDSLKLANEILTGKHPDPTNGATHYLNPNHPSLKGKPLPSWTKKLREVILDTTEKIYHTFFKY